MGIRWPAQRLPFRPMDAGLRRHDEGMAVISNVVTALFADIVSEAAIRPENIQL